MPMPSPNSKPVDTAALIAKVRALRTKPDGDPNCDIWYCKIGHTASELNPRGADSPMRAAVEKAFARVTGKPPDYIFSGWGQTLTESELAVVENREPVYEK